MLYITTVIFINSYRNTIYTFPNYNRSFRHDIIIVAEKTESYWLAENFAEHGLNRVNFEMADSAVSNPLHSTDHGRDEIHWE